MPTVENRPQGGVRPINRVGSQGARGHWGGPPPPGGGLRPLPGDRLTVTEDACCRRGAAKVGREGRVSERRVSTTDTPHPITADRPGKIQDGRPPGRRPRRRTPTGWEVRGRSGRSRGCVLGNARWVVIWEKGGWDRPGQSPPPGASWGETPPRARQRPTAPVTDAGTVRRVPAGSAWSEGRGAREVAQGVPGQGCRRRTRANL